MAGSNSQEPTLNENAQTWYDVRSKYRLQQKKAFDAAALVPSEPGTVAPPVDTCVPAVLAKRCPAGNDAFIPLPDDSPEYEDGEPAEGVQPAQGWPMSAELYAAIAQAFSAQHAASATIPLQLQANTLESYRKSLLHKKWRRCHHLVAMAKNLAPEVRAEEELQQLLLGEQVGNKTDAD